MEVWLAADGAVFAGCGKALGTCSAPAFCR
jgi:hypothetical protein